MEVYRYTNKNGEKYEYRFDNGICVGFFVDDKPLYTERYKGKVMTESWREGLKEAEFLLTNNI